MAFAQAAPAQASIPVAAVQPLVERLGSEDASKRSSAEKALLEMGPEAIAPLLEILAQGDVAEVGPIRALLPKYGPNAVEHMFRAGRRDYAGTGSRVMWEAAAEAVANMGAAVVPSIMDWFENPYGSTFGFATRVLAVMQEQDRRATPLLTPLLSSPKEEVRRAAAALLANFPDPRAYEALLGALKSEDASVRGHAVRGLGRLQDSRAAEAIFAMTWDRPWPNRRTAAAALGRIYEPRFRGRLGHMARNEDEAMTRDTAANVLIYSGDPLAARLGRRYKPLALSPARQRGIALTYFVLLGVSFVFVALVALASVLGLRKHGQAPWLITGLAGCALASGGFVWGGLVPNITAAVENVLLLVVVPLAACAVYGVGALAKVENLRPGLMSSFGVFYLGYGLGWLWLWGHLVF